ncbi:MAG: hypothetical protein MRT15_03930 [archaeon YNP-LCB-003-016]|uniref:hypothetical protein n=1 Tax=Candidatus Culexarchaeum yellowstonense TaxID=2928963 RepID=UPI0026F0E3E2|nr:hypothetical protein [Candidatus Culexarchaeum yellowstonense]MCR6691517.1 hypothetical protein [Candidatus Culexarchaeum yellowstonense]
MPTFARPEVSIGLPQALPLSEPKWSVLYETDFRCLSDVRMFKVSVLQVGGTWKWIGGLSYPLKSGSQTAGVYEISYAVFPCMVKYARFFMRAKPVNNDPSVLNYLELDYAWRDINNFRRAVLTLTVASNNFTIGKRVAGTWVSLATGTTPWGATPLGTELEFSGYTDGSVHTFIVKRLDTGASLTLSASDVTEGGYVAMGNVRNYDARFDHFRVERL